MVDVLGDLLIHYQMLRVRRFHQWPAAEKPATQGWSATLGSRRLSGFAHRRMNGRKVASPPNLTGKPCRVDNSIAAAGQYRVCQRIAVGGAACEDGACTRRDVLADFRRVADICHHSMVVRNECWKESATDFARYS